MLEDSGVRYRSSVVGLDEIRVELDRRGCVCDGVSISLEFDVGLGAVGVERRLLVVGLDCLGVESCALKASLPLFFRATASSIAMVGWCRVLGV
jgi:hypothetical protein